MLVQMVFRKARSAFAIGALPGLLALCASPSLAQQVAEASGENVTAVLENRAEAGAARAEFSDQETRGEASRDFEYGWPAQADAIPEFAAVLRAARDEALAMQKSEWEQSIAEFGPGTPNAGCITCINRSYSAGWSVSAETSRMLVLQASRWIYSGGAHGNSDFDALMWDKEANDGAGAVMRPVAMFTSEAALENAAYGDYCQALLEQRGERLEANIDGLDKFEDCPSVSDLVVVPTSSDGANFDALTFLAAPYVAGSYAEGPYIFEIPVTAALIDVVRPEYSAQFFAAE